MTEAYTRLREVVDHHDEMFRVWEFRRKGVYDPANFFTVTDIAALADLVVQLRDAGAGVVKKPMSGLAQDALIAALAAAREAGVTEVGVTG